MPKNITAGITWENDTVVKIDIATALPVIEAGGAIDTYFFEKFGAPAFPQYINEVVPITVRDGRSGVLAIQRREDDPYWGRKVFPNGSVRVPLWHTIGTAVRRVDFSQAGSSRVSAFERLKRDEMQWSGTPVQLPFALEGIGVRGATVSLIFWVLVNTEDKLPHGVRFFSRQQLEDEMEMPEEHQEFIVEQIPFILRAMDDFNLTQQALTVMRLREYPVDYEHAREGLSDAIAYMVKHSHYRVVDIAHAVETAWDMYVVAKNNG